MTGAGCGDWTDAESAQTLRPCTNMDVSKIKGEEGDINTCKRCVGKVNTLCESPEIWTGQNSRKKFVKQIGESDVWEKAAIMTFSSVCIGKSICRHFTITTVMSVF